MSRFDDAIRRFDDANAEDPILERVDGEERPKELVYGERMSERLARFAPDAPEAVPRPLISYRSSPRSWNELSQHLLNRKPLARPRF